MTREFDLITELELAGTSLRTLKGLYDIFEDKIANEQAGQVNIVEVVALLWYLNECFEREVAGVEEICQAYYDLRRPGQA